MTFLMKFGVLPAVSVGLYLITIAASDPRQWTEDNGCSAVASTSMNLDVREALECVKCRLAT